MYYETITKYRLKIYLRKVQKLNLLYRIKHNLENQCGLKGVDLSKTKVTNGNSEPFSTPEQFTIRLEKINNRIKEARAFLDTEHKELVAQISRLDKPEWAMVITYKYIEGWKMPEIIAAFFCDQADFEVEKDFKYRKTIERWLASGIKNLQKVSCRPFIEIEKQLVIEDLKNAQ